MYCNYCGKVIQDDTNLCAYCGKRVGAVTARKRLLRPLPANHGFWRSVSHALVSRYRLLLPDLRGHGESGVVDGPAFMEKHAEDIARILDHADSGRVPFVGVSIGGYIFFEFWRRYRGRIAAVALCNTKAPADTPEGKASRLQAANDALERGTEPFFESM